MAKQRYKRESGLTEQQQAAISLLLSGKSQVDTAANLGLDVNTVNRWCNHDSLFIATLNQRRQDIYHSQIERLRNLVDKAITVLGAGLDSADEKTAISSARAILKAVQMDGIPAPTGATDPDDVEAQQHHDELVKSFANGLLL